MISIKAPHSIVPVAQLGGFATLLYLTCVTTLQLEVLDFGSDHTWNLMLVPCDKSIINRHVLTVLTVLTVGHFIGKMIKRQNKRQMNQKLQ